MKDAVAAGCKSVLMQVVLNVSGSEVFMMKEKIDFFLICSIWNIRFVYRLAKNLFICT
jgi:hypothetical protein